MWCQILVLSMRSVSQCLAIPYGNPTPHRDMQELSHGNVPYPTKVSRTLTPIFQTIKENFQPHCDPNTWPRKQHNGILPPQQPGTGSNWVRTRYKIIQFPCRGISRMRYKLVDVISMEVHHSREHLTPLPGYEYDLATAGTEKLP